MLRHLCFGPRLSAVSFEKRRYRCPCCGHTEMESVPFKAAGHNITRELLQFTRDLLAYGFTNKEVSELTGLGKNTVKEIDLQRLKDKYTVDGKTLILDMLRAIRAAIDHDSDTVPDKKGYYILQLDYKKHLLKRLFFKPSELEQANKLYDYLEAKNADAPLDIVLVRATSYATVRDAYPNYFMDIGEFIGIIMDYLR